MISSKERVAILSDHDLQISTIPLRIRIGVTGHRTLSQESTLAERVRSVLTSKIIDLFEPSSRKLMTKAANTPLRFSVVSPIAEGADRLVAREVLRTPDAKIQVVLPFAREDYIQDFKSDESRREFEELLQKCRNPITIDAYRESNLSTVRRERFASVGRYVVDNCDVLIALWDGKPASGEGGTANIVAYARERRRPLVIISTVEPFDITIEQNLGINGRSIDSIDEFNSYKISPQTLASYTQNVEREIFSTEESQSMPVLERQLVRDLLIPFYVRASLIAKQNQKIYLRSGTLVYSLSALAVAAVALSVVFPAYSTYEFVTEALFLLVIFAIVHFADRRRTHKRWIESRFLTERIRMSCLFAACGIEVSPIKIPPYLRVAHQPDDWMVRVFNEVWDRLPPLQACTDVSYRDIGAFIRKSLVQDQLKFHEKKTLATGRKSHVLERVGKWVFLAALVATLLHIGFHSMFQNGPLESLLIYLALSLPAIGAALGGIRTHREYSRLEKRSQNMATVLADLDQRFDNVKNQDDLEALLRETEELMLRETQDWLMLMKFVKVEAV